MNLIDRCLCGSDRWPRMFGKNGLIFAECICGLIHLHSETPADEYEAQYLGPYHAAGDRHAGCVPYTQRYDHDLKVAAIRWERYCNTIRGAPGRLRTALDVGCANGAFVDFLRSRNVDAWGVDPDPMMARAHVVSGTGRTLNLVSDLVTYHDVLEHVLDPAAELAAAFRRVNPGGVLIVDVPDVTVPEGSHHFKAEHPWYFTERVLHDLLLNAGFCPFATDRPLPGKLVIYSVRPS